MYSLPQGLFYSRNHTWAYLEKSGNAKIGVDDFLLQVTGDVKIIHLKNSGEKVRKGESVAEVEQNGKRLKVFSPVSGEIIAINHEVEENQGLANMDPYEQGWLYAVKPSSWVFETKNYLMADAATNWIKKEVDRLRDFLVISLGKHDAGISPIALQEGGEIRSNVLSELDDEIWKEFQETFLDSLHDDQEE